MIWNFDLVGDTWSYRFPAPGDVPKDMALVPAGTFELYLPGLDHLKPEPTTAFLMDRHEVTNADYKRFVEAGGYREEKHWQEPFVDGERRLTFAEAMARFIDSTGRPGPATWEVGTYPAGRGEHPVTGVSWYEAAAYAAWAGKSLPTVFHWNRVAFTVGSSRIVPLANLGGSGSAPVGNTHSVNRYGVEDLAGNVREWTWNASGDAGSRFILGGGWNDPDYALRRRLRAARLRPLGDQRLPLHPLPRGRREPRRSHALDRSTVRVTSWPSGRSTTRCSRSTCGSSTTTPSRWTPRSRKRSKRRPGAGRRSPSHAAYGGERMMAYLFLPPAGRPPYQVVVYFPGSGAISTRSSATLDLGRLDFIATSGRAVIYPIYKGTYERGGELNTDYPEETTDYKDYVIMWGKDLRRSIDYLETRQDLDASRIAYYGLSWGGAMGAILPAVEPRIKTNVLYVAGLAFQRALPEADAINYIGRVRQPTLILNGELDFFFPLESSQRPMFELLGTPAEHKKRLIFPGGHSVPRTEMIKESLAWLDQYLGPVTNP